MEDMKKLQAEADALQASLTPAEDKPVPGDQLPAGELADAEPKKPPAPISEEVQDILKMVVKGLEKPFPRATALWPAETRKELGDLLQDLCIKHGWLQEGVMRGAGPEVALLFFGGTMGYSTYKAVQIDLAALAMQEQIPAESTDATQPAPAATA